ncbi:hypothetical protein M3B38_01690 [Dietzia cinnamea]|uniref:hypothetical protein n=1 Tax=Dietzia cinnamea TaxID=321318 RepID=UPI0021A68F9C|nr:hypothetical protein [Dietzia cinnamea]MCT1710702.1 hypothetical protein [Dietzia cinnamea]
MTNPDPIEKISAEIEIHGIPQADGAPPMTTSYFHVRRRQDGAVERAVLGLPAYRGKEGPAGPPGAIHQGERDTAELEALATALGTQHINWAYRNTDTDDQYVWTGQTWVIYHGVYATPGPVGPAPTITPGTLTIDGVEHAGPFGVRVSGSGGSYSVGVDLPKMPKGDQGDAGPAGPIFTSVDVDQSSTRSDGDVLVYNGASGKLEWGRTVYGIEEFAVPPSYFPSVSNLPGSTTRRELFSLEIPARDYPYRLDFSGGVDVDVPFGYHVDIEIRSGNVSTGKLVGLARDDSSQGWHRLVFFPYSEDAFDPETPTTDVIAPGTPQTLYVSAVRRQGGILPWALRRDYAQLRVRLMRVA